MSVKTATDRTENTAVDNHRGPFAHETWEDRHVMLVYCQIDIFSPVVLHHQSCLCFLMAVSHQLQSGYITRQCQINDQIETLEGKYSLESTDPCESEIRAHLRPYFSVEWVELIMYYLFIMHRFVYIGNWFVYIGKNHRFTVFLDSNLHTRLAIVTKNEPGLAFSPETFSKNFVQIRPRFI